MSHYTTDKIVEIISDYSINIINVHEYNQDDDMESVGVAVISALPSSTGVSDQVANQAIRRASNGLFFSELATDIRYLEQRLDRITSERNAQVVSLSMQGFTRMDIAEVLGVSKMTVGRLLKIAASEIKG